MFRSEAFSEVKSALFRALELSAILLIMLAFFCSPVGSQGRVPGVMKDAMKAVASFVDDPSRDNLAGINGSISRIDSLFSAAGKLSDYQLWNLSYMQAFLFYARGIAMKSGECMNSYDRADSIFSIVNGSYRSDYDRAKNDYATYMRAWCGIRAFLDSGKQSRIDGALEILDGIDCKDLEDDIAFLNGYANFIKALDGFRKLSVSDGLYEAVNSASESFASLRFHREVGETSRLFYLYSSWLKHRILQLYRLRRDERGLSEGPDTAEIPEFEQLSGGKLDDFLSKLNSGARQLADSLQGTRAGSEVRYMDELLQLQRASETVKNWISVGSDSMICLNQQTLTGRFYSGTNKTVDLKKDYRDIIECSRAFITNRPVGSDKNLSGEARLWSSLSILNSYMQNDLRFMEKEVMHSFFEAGDFVDNLPLNLFDFEIEIEKGIVADSALAAEKKVFEGYYNYLSVDQASEPDNVFLRLHSEKSKPFSLLSEYTGYAKHVTDSGRLYPRERRIKDILNDNIDTGFNVEECINAGLWAMNLADCIPRIGSSKERERRTLYTAAYMLFHKALNKKNIAQTEQYARISILKAFSLFNSATAVDTDNSGKPDNMDALNSILSNILSEDKINGWPSGLRNEARFHRAMMERHAEGRYEPATRTELEHIARVDPRAAYALGFEAVNDPNEELLANGGCLLQKAGCMEWLNNLYGVKVGIVDYEKDCGEPDIGPEDVRYDILKYNMSECNSTRQFILDELDIMLKLWSVAVQPPAVLMPWRAGEKEDYRFKGPAEFAYLADEVKVDVNISGGGSGPAHLVVLSDESKIVYEGSVSGLGKLRSGQRYIFIVSKHGCLPSMKERTFYSYGETLDINLGRAYLEPSGDCRVKEETDRNLLFWDNEGAMVTMGPAGVRYYLDGKEIIGRPKPGGSIINLSRFMVCRDRIFGFDNKSRDIIKMDEDLEVLNMSSSVINPYDCASDGEVIYVADRENGRIAVYDPSKGLFTDDRVNRTELSPILLAAFKSGGRTRLAVNDQEKGLCISGNDITTYGRASGFRGALDRGLNRSFRIMNYFKDPGLLVCRNNIFDNRLFLFLPMGEYVGRLTISGKITPPFHYIEYSTSSGDRPVLRIATNDGLVECGLEIDNNYEFTLSGNLSKVELSSETVKTGGWFSSWRN